MNDKLYDLYLEKRDFEIKQAFSLYKNAQYYPLFSNPKPKHYRHKVTLSAVNVNKQLKLGLFIPNTKIVKPQIYHELHDETINKLLVDVEKTLQLFKILAYDTKTPKGILKHVLVKKSFANQDIMIIFVTQTSLFPQHKQIINALVNLYPNIKTVIQNIHQKETKYALLDEEKILYGNGVIVEQIDDLKFELSASSFYQVNPYVSKELYKAAIDRANICDHDIVFDCYSGVGTLTLLIAKYAKRVYGVEINKKAHLNAVANKKLNQQSHVKFVCGDANELLINTHDKPSIVFVDPTRTGLSETFIKSLLTANPHKIIYISCNYETQLRDIKKLGDMYRVKSIQAFDMFSFTDEIETLVVLEKKNTR